MSACGECAQAILPIGDPSFGRIFHGCLHSIVAIVLVRLGGFRLFEILMTICVGIMFVTVVSAAVLSGPNWSDVGRGMLAPSTLYPDEKTITWSLTLMAGVGGTLTMLCYGPWIRESGRSDISSLSTCRIDLGMGYLMTAIFGIAMVILGSQLPIGQGLKGANLIAALADNMETQLDTCGNVAAWMFRIGAWGAVFSSLLGVWQSVPALVCEMLPSKETNPDEERQASVSDGRYTKLLLALGIAPGFMLPFSLATVQKTAGVTGALFIPIFAFTLLVLPLTEEGRRAGFRNGWLSRWIMTFCLLLFGYLAIQKIFRSSETQRSATFTSVIMYRAMPKTVPMLERPSRRRSEFAEAACEQPLLNFDKFHNEV